MRIAQHRLEAAEQGLVGQHGVEIHRNFGHANALALGRNRRMQIGQRFLVIEPSEFGHKALDQPKHALGAIDEATLHFVSIRILAAITPLVEEPFGARRIFWRRQIQKSEEITRLIMRALLLEFGAALNVDQGRRHIREIAFRIFAGGMPLRLDEDSPARAEPTQRIVQSAGDADEFRRHGGIQIRPPKPRGALKRSILVEDDTLVDQSGPGQEIRKLRGRAAVFSEIHHRLKPPNGWKYGDGGARRRRIADRASRPTPRRLTENPSKRPAIHSRRPRPSAAARVPLRIATARGAPPSRIGSVSARCTGTVKPANGKSDIGNSPSHQHPAAEREERQEEGAGRERDREAEHDLDQTAKSS